MESALDLLVIVLQMSWIIAHPAKPAVPISPQPQIKSHEPNAIDKQVNEYLMPILSSHLGGPTPVPYSTVQQKDLRQISDLSELIKLLPPSILTKKIKFGGKGKKLLEITAVRPKFKSTSKAPVAILLATNPNKDNVKFIDSVVNEKDERDSIQDSSFIKSVSETKAKEELTEKELSTKPDDNTQKKLLEILTDSELRNVFNVVLEESDWKERNKNVVPSNLQYSTESEENTFSDDSKKEETIEKQDIIEKQDSTEQSEDKKQIDIYKSDISEKNNVIVHEDIKQDFYKSDVSTSANSEENLEKDDNDDKSSNEDKLSTSEEITTEKGEYEDLETKIHEKSELAIHRYHNNENKASNADNQKNILDRHDNDGVEAKLYENHDLEPKNYSEYSHHIINHKHHDHGVSNKEEDEVKIEEDQENLPKIYEINEYKNLYHQKNITKEQNHYDSDDSVSNDKEVQVMDMVRQHHEMKSDEYKEDEGENDQEQVQEERSQNSHDHHSRFHYANDHQAATDNTLTEGTLAEIRQQSANTENNQEILLSDDTVARLQIALTRAENAENPPGVGSTASNECSPVGFTRSANPSEFTKKSGNANSNGKSYNLSFLFNK